MTVCQGPFPNTTSKSPGQTVGHHQARDVACVLGAPWKGLANPHSPGLLTTPQLLDTKAPDQASPTAMHNFTGDVSKVGLVLAHVAHRASAWRSLLLLVWSLVGAWDWSLKHTGPQVAGPGSLPSTGPALLGPRHQRHSLWSLKPHTSRTQRQDLGPFLWQKFYLLTHSFRAESQWSDCFELLMVNINRKFVTDGH